MVKMWKYFLHIRGEIVSEDFEIYNVNRKQPSRKTKKRACLDLILDEGIVGEGVV
jgi:hypothetical protein